ncbi:hypothetical protein [Brucella pseudogrignonensis]|uniref:Uncharacterized protein n=1 Tax=Brucella pseudogrignonensis TaxID=419475 RepID=A0A256GFE2_9HYPH|nr:hypothetical protein [Brucella pseudogrignonensis]OYR25855.1 hypothetical protein CEV34_2637 [Brucella pseudogrignonensis]
MSGGGHIIEKMPVTLESGKQVIRYHVMDRHDDEVCVYAEPAGTEPQLRDQMWWGGAQIIYFGENDTGRLTKVGYSFRPGRQALKGG